jgi:hypothetical protein
MRIIKSGHEIESVEDWFKYAPPRMGKLHWKDNRSAKELARSWFRKESACSPEEMRLLLERTFQTEIELIEAKPECVIELDDFAGEHRNPTSLSSVMSARNAWSSMSKLRRTNSSVI